MPARAAKFRLVHTDGKEIRRIREHAGLSRSDITERSGGLVTYSALAMIERGERGGRPGTVKAIADALGVTVAEIVVEDEPVWAVA